MAWLQDPDGFGGDFSALCFGNGSSQQCAKPGCTPGSQNLGSLRGSLLPACLIPVSKEAGSKGGKAVEMLGRGWWWNRT